MIRRSILFLAGILCLNAVSAQDLPDRSLWQGQLGPIRLILRVFPDSLSGKQKAVFDSPDQNATNLAISEFKVTGDSLLAFSKAIGGGFTGRFTPDKTQIIGSWKQGMVNAPLTLIRITSLAAPVERPQTPKRPFPYKSENIEYDNESKTVHFGATLTMPDSTKPVAAVILISGSGQQDRDETIYNHKPFAVIADHLTRHGIAVLRVDDRGVGQSTGEVMKATTADFAKDVLTHISYLKTRKEVDPKKIGLIGHSEGGMIATLLASQSKDVAFIVSMAGLGIKGVDVIKQQNADMLKMANLPAAQYKALTGLYFKLFDVVYATDVNKPLNLKGEFLKWRTRQAPALVDSMKLNEGQAGEKMVENFIQTVSLPWMRYFINYNPELKLAKIKVPVLAINGSKDIQVDATANLAGFKKSLTMAGNKDFKTIELAGLNHLFQTAETGYPGEYATIEETISPYALQVITDWLILHTR